MMVIPCSIKSHLSIFLKTPEISFKLHEIRIRASKFVGVLLKQKDSIETGAESEYKASFFLLQNRLFLWHCWCPLNGGLLTHMQRCSSFTEEPQWRKFTGHSLWLPVLFIKSENCKHLPWGQGKIESAYLKMPNRWVVKTNRSYTFST